MINNAPTLIQHFLENSASRLPDKVALICGDDRLTYREINEKADCLASFLRDRGIRRQDRVAIFLDNSVESVISLFGILKADAIFLMLSQSLKAKKLAYILNNCQVKALITHTNKLNVVSEILGSVPSLESVIFVGDKDKISLTNCPNPISWHEIASLYSSNPSNLSNSQPVTRNPQQSLNIDLDLATIIYTSGSTGNPKGVMLTHLNMVSAATSITTYLENREEDIILDVLPLSFDYGLYQVLMAFKFGGTVVLEHSFAFSYQVIQKMNREKVTGFPVVPTILAMLFGFKDLKKFDFSRLRYVSNTAAALPPAHIKQCRTFFPDVRIYSMYGLTECKRVSYLPPEEIDRRPDSVGRAMPNEEVWIVDEEDRPARLGIVGELVVRGSNVMRGYWGLPEETARVLRPGRYPGEQVLYTGDLFRMDEEGYLYFVGRKDDVFKSRGERISPKEIESCLCCMEGVTEAAVFGIPNEVLGQAIVAFVRCAEGWDVTEKKAMKHCQLHLEDFMLPSVVRLVPEFPKTANGKIDKSALWQKYLVGEGTSPVKPGKGVTVQV